MLEFEVRNVPQGCWVERSLALDVARSSNPRDFLQFYSVPVTVILIRLQWNLERPMNVREIHCRQDLYVSDYLLGQAATCFGLSY